MSPVVGVAASVILIRLLYTFNIVNLSYFIDQSRSSKFLYTIASPLRVKAVGIPYSCYCRDPGTLAPKGSACYEYGSVQLYGVVALLEMMMSPSHHVGMR